MSNQWAGIAQAASSVIGTAGGMIQGARNRRAQRKENQRQRDWSREMFDLQNLRDIEFWQMQNQYNDPAAQMQRLKDAGLNPNLVYGNGADAQAGPIATHTAPQPRTAPERYENELAPLADSIFNYLSVQQQKANIRRTDAETDAIQQKNVEQVFNNEVLRSLGVEKVWKNKSYQMDIDEINASKQGAEFNAWLAGSFDGKASNDPNSPIAKAIRAGYFETVVAAENAVKLGSIRDLETTIKSFQANLAKQGIDPNTPWYGKILVDLLSKIAGRPIMELLIDPKSFKLQ